MPPHPQVFPPLSEGAIASYDYYDFASSVGYKTFYPADFSGATYSLVTETIYSHAGYTAGECDLDFDVEFKRACDIKGDVWVNVPCVRFNATGGGLTIGYTIQVYIRKYSTTETDLGNAITADNQTEISPTSFVSNMNALKITVAQTHFNAGDKLRVSLVFVGTAEATRIAVGHDPKNRTDIGTTGWWTTAGGAQSKVDIPFVLNN